MRTERQKLIEKVQRRIGMNSAVAQIYQRPLLYKENNMRNQAIQVKGLQKSYKQLHVLKGVDFEVEKGSIFALLGYNGAGKTTIVKILATLLKQDGGTAAV